MTCSKYIYQGNEKKATCSILTKVKMFFNRRSQLGRAVVALTFLIVLIVFFCCNNQLNKLLLVIIIN